jgi:dihydrofolate reductase
MNLIACINDNWAIGYKNQLLYNIPQDMQYFKSKTLNTTVVMGKNTYNSLRIKPLPNRINIVLSSSMADQKGIIVCHNVGEVFAKLTQTDPHNVYIIGGESVYSAFLGNCNRAYITKVRGTCQADAYFPNLDSLPNWHLVETSQTFTHLGLEYTFNTYEKLT